jgi:hypothetical protein
LSIKAKDSDEEATVMKEYSEAAAGTPTMGDLFIFINSNVILERILL